ncbi:hypothetical protein RP20_CCG008904 [Aedes albopictus]|nr:hypothetical protein RP20_CCG008904 [Aedes albopictus]
MPPIAADVPAATASKLPHDNSNSHTNSLNNSKRSNNSARSSGNTKATVHINGIAVDHFQQNSDVDEDRSSLAAASCPNNDIHGFISYSSDSSMIELNLKFKKCACNENIINISKENLQQQRTEQRNSESSLAIATKQRNSESSLAIATSMSSAGGLLSDSTAGIEGASATAAATSFNKEVGDGKLKSAAQANANAKEQTPTEIAIGNAAGGSAEKQCNRTLKVVNKLGSPSNKAASWSPLLPSPCSHSPSPSVSTDDPNRLQRRHSETVERRSIGIQHGLKSGYRKKHQLRKGKTQVEEIIVISDEFRRQSLSDQKVRIQKSKKYSLSMESIDKQVDEQSGKIGGGVFECLHLENDTLTVVVDSSAATNGHKKSNKSKSKSVDDISLSSNHNEEEFPPTGALSNAANSVELVFISDEFVQRKTRTSSDVIIVDANKKSLKRRKSTTSKNVIIITDDYKQKSSTARSDVRIVKSNSLKSKDPRRKTTISNSNSFLTYEEPFSPETLENKDIGTMFAEASAAAASK